MSNFYLYSLHLNHQYYKNKKSLISECFLVDTISSIFFYNNELGDMHVANRSISNAFIALP